MQQPDKDFSILDKLKEGQHTPEQEKRSSFFDEASEGLTNSISSDYSEADFESYTTHDVVLFDENKDKWDDERAENQTSGELWEKALTQLGAEVTLGTAEALAGLPDVFINGAKMVAGGKTDFENDLASVFRELKEDVNANNEVYRASYDDSSGIMDSSFDPSSARWWASNASSIGSAATFILPTMAVTGAVSKLAKGAKALSRASKELKAVKKMGALAKKAPKVGWMDNAAKYIKDAKGVELPNFAQKATKLMTSEKGVSALAGTMYSNASESFQEAVGMSRNAYDEALAAGHSEESANEIAAKVGADIYKGNFINIALELPSTLALMKGFRGTRNLINKTAASKLANQSVSGLVKEVGQESAEAIFKKSPNFFMRKGAEFGVEAVTEGGQEIVNYISGKEAEGSYKDAILGQEAKTTYASRVFDDYLKQGDLWTGAFMGALGGTMFTSLASVKGRVDNKFSKNDKSSSRQDRDLRKLQPLRLMDIAAMRNDKELGRLAEDKIIFEKAIDHAESGTMGEFEKELKDISTLPKEDLEKLGIDDASKVEEIIEKARKVERAYEESVDRIGVRDIDNNKNRGIDFNKDLTKEIYGEETSREHYQELDARKVELEGKLSEFLSARGKDAEALTIPIALNKELNAAKASIAQIEERYAPLLSGDKKGTQAINKSHIDFTIKAKKRTIAKKEKDYKQYLKDNNLENTDVSLKEFEGIEEFDKAIVDLDQIALANTLHKQKIKLLSTKEGRAKWRKAEEEDVKDAKEEVTDVIASTSNTNTIEEAKEKFEEATGEKFEVEVKDEVNVDSIEEGGGLDFDDINLDDVNFDKVNLDGVNLQGGFEGTKEKKPKTDSEILPPPTVDTESTFDYSDTFEIRGDKLGVKYNKENEVDGKAHLVDEQGNKKIVDSSKLKAYGRSGGDASQKENITLGKFSTLETFTKNFDENTLEAFREILSKEDWQDNIQIVANTNYVKQNIHQKGKTVGERITPDSKGVKTLHLDERSKGLGKKIYISNTMDIDLVVNIKTKDGWVKLGDIANPDQYVYAESDSEVAVPLDLSTVSYEMFKNNFYVNKNEPTEAQFNRIAEDYKKLKEFHTSMIAFYGKEGKSEVEIKDFLNYSVVGNDYEYAEGIGISLAKYSHAQREGFAIIDAIRKVDLTTGERVTTPDTPLEGRYIARVKLPSGVETFIPLRPTKLSPVKTKEFLTKLQELKTLLGKPVIKGSEEYNSIISREAELLDSLGVYIHPQKVGEENKAITIGMSYSESSKSFYLNARNTKDSSDKRVSITKAKTLPDLIALLNKEFGTSLTENSFKTSIAEGQKVDKSNFTSLISENIYKNFNIHFSPKDAPNAAPVTPTKVEVVVEEEAPYYESDYEGLSFQQLEEKRDKLFMEGGDEAEIEYIQNKLNEFTKSSNPVTENEAPPTQQPTQEDTTSDDYNLPNGDLFNLRTGETKLTSEWLSKHLPNIPVELKDSLLSIGGIEASGAFVKGVIQLAEVGEKGTDFHEGFHAVFKSYLERGERDSLLKEEERLSGVPSEGSIKALRSRVPSYDSLTDTQIIDIILEERLADRFQNYMLDKTSPSFFTKLFSTLKSFVKWVTGNRTKADSLFRFISKGGFKDSALVMPLVENEVPKYSLLVGQSTVKSEKIIKSVAGNVINKINSGETTNDISTEEGLEKEIVKVIDYYKGLYDYKAYSEPSDKVLAAKEQSPYSNTESREIIIKEVTSILGKYTVSEVTNELDEAEASEEGERNWDISMSEVGGSDNVSKEMKLFIALTTYKGTDSLGNTIEQAVDFEKTFGTLQRALASKDRADQLDLLSHLSEDNNQIGAVYTKLKSLIPSFGENAVTMTVNERSLYNKFFSTFELEHVNFIQVLLDLQNKSVRYFSSNQNDTKNILLNDWEKAYVDFSEVSKDKVKKLNEGEDAFIRLDSAKGKTDKDVEAITYTEAIRDIQTSMKSIGVDLSSSYLRYVLEREDTGDVYKFSGEDIAQIREAVKRGENPFGGENGEGNRGRLLKIADADSLFRDDLFTSTSQDSEGKTRHSFLLPSYMARKFRELKKDLQNSTELEKLKKEGTIDSYNPLLQGENSSISELFSHSAIAMTGGIREEQRNTQEDTDENARQKEGMEFKNLTPFDYLLKEHGLYNSIVKETRLSKTGKKINTGRELVYYTLDTKESKSSSFSHLLERKDTWVDETGEITSETVEFVISTMFQQEYKRLKGDFGTDFKNHTFLTLPFLNTPKVYEALGLTPNGKKPNTYTPVEEGVYKPLIEEEVKKGLQKMVADYKALLTSQGVLNARESLQHKASKLPMKFDTKEGLDNYLGNYMMNFLVNSVGMSQLMYGDGAKLKDSVDIVKRAGGGIAFGPSGGEGNYDVAYVAELEEYFDLATGEQVTKEEYEKDQEEGGKKVIDNSTEDAQVYTTLAWRRHSLEARGELTQAVSDVIDKLEAGEKLTKKEEPLLDLISEKGIHYDATAYHKMSEFVLTKALTSRTTDGGKTWVAKRGKERLHNMRVFMEVNQLDKVVPTSASKIQSNNIIPSEDFDTGKVLGDFTVDTPYEKTTLANQDWRLQLANASGKEKIVLATQLIQLIDTELPNTDEYKSIRKELYDTFQEVRNLSVDHAVELSKDDEVLSERFIESVLGSGGDASMVEFLQQQDGEFVHSFNLPQLKDKSSQLLLSIFNKDVLSQKVKGNKSTLVSSAGYKVLADPTGKVVEDKGQKGEGYKTRSLRIHKSVEGKIEYAEVAMTKRQAKQLNIVLGEPITKEIQEELFTMLGTRIPAQTHHSMIPFRVVEFLPEMYGDVIVAPAQIVYLSGADYDVDSLYSQRKDFYVDKEGKPQVYGKIDGKELTEDSDKYEQFIQYHKANNKELKKIVKKVLDNDFTYKDLSNEYTTLAKTILPELKEGLASLGGNSWKEAAGGLEGLAALVADLEQLDIEQDTKAKEGLEETRNKIEGDIEEGIKRVKELKEILTDIKDSVYVENLKNVNLPSSLEEFSTYKYKDTKGALDNKMLDLMLKVITRPELKESLFTPATMTGLKEDSKVIFEKLRGETEGGDSVYSPQGVMASWWNNSIGKKTVGNIANANLISAFLTKMQVSLNSSLYNIIIDGRTFSDYSTLYENDVTLEVGEDGKVILGEVRRRKADTLSSVVSAATDNAKERLMAKLNLTVDNLSEFANLISLGVGRTRTMLIASQPSMIELAEGLTNSKSKLGTPTGRAQVIDNILDSYLNSYEQETGKVLDITKVDFSLDSKELLKELNSTDTSTPLTQIKVLLFYKEVSKATQPFLKIGRLLKLNKGVGTSTGDLISLLDDMKSLGLVEEGKGEFNNSFKGLQEALDFNGAVKDNVKHLQSVIKATKSRFIAMTDPVEKLSSNMKKIMFLPKKEDSKFRDKFVSYLGMQYLSKNSKTSFKDFNDLVVLGDNDTIVTKYESLKSDKDFMANPFVTRLIVLRTENTGLPIDKLEINSRIKYGEETIKRYTDGFEELYESPKYNEFATDLIHYLIAKDGFQFKNGSFIKFIPPRLFKELSKGYKEINKALATGKSLKPILGYEYKVFEDNFVEKYVRTTKNAKNLVSYNVKEIEGFNSYLEGEVLKVTPKKSLETMVKEGIAFGDITRIDDRLALTYPAYFKDNEQGIFKLTGTKGSEGTYKVVSPLHITNHITGYSSSLKDLEAIDIRTKGSTNYRVKSSLDEGLDNFDDADLSSLDGTSFSKEESTVKSAKVTPPTTVNAFPSQETTPKEGVETKVEPEKPFTTKVNQFTYTYNPSTDEVIHNAKAGDKVETRLTQIGKVLSLYASAKNLETKEFNKQSYSLVGNKVVNVKTGTIVTQKEILNLFLLGESTYDEVWDEKAREFRKIPVSKNSTISFEEDATHNVVADISVPTKEKAEVNKTTEELKKRETILAEKINRLSSLGFNKSFSGEIDTNDLDSADGKVRDNTENGTCT